jgi:hypothetical protein
MANTLTSLIPSIYQSLDVVSRELVGFIPAVSMNASAARAAKDQSILIPIVPALSASDITPAVTVPDDGDVNVGNVEMKITKSRAVRFRWNGEEQQGLNAAGPGFAGIQQDQFAQAFRALCNEIEADLAALYKSASRAYGTPGTTPFASNLADSAQVRKILDDNGCPPSDRQLVIDTTAGANLRTLAQLTKTNEAGTDSILKQGMLIELHGFMLRESAQVKSHTKGTGASYALNNASGYAAGSTTIAVDTGSGTILAGDVFTNSQSGRDANKYVVGTALSAGSLALNKPGNRGAWVDNDTVAVGNSYTANMAFHRSAMQLIARAPALPGGRDSAVDRRIVIDPRSGLAFEVSEYLQYRQTSFEVAIAWGTKAIKSEHMALLLG